MQSNRYEGKTMTTKPLTEKQLNEKGIYTGNPLWANRFNVIQNTP